MDNKFKSAIALGGFIIFVIIIGATSSKEDVELLQDTNNESIKQEFLENSSGEVEKIYVHVIGAVNNAGIVEAPKGVRLYEIVELAGGLQENADETLINLAAKVEDGEKIIIPYKENLSTGSSTKKINELYKSTTSQTYDKININIASIEELKTLTGIGQSTAEKIINYREDISKFEKIDDIKNVSGIGDSKFNSIKDKIVVK
jgi:competence protein ComEA